MSEPSDPIPRPPVPPMLPEAPSERRGPWGFWATAGWGVIVAGGWLVAQFAAMMGYMVVSAIVSHSHSFPPMESVASSGTVLSLAALLSAPPAVGLCWLFVKLRNGPALRDYLGLTWPCLKTVVAWSVGSAGFIVAEDLLTSGLGKPIAPEVMVELYRSTDFKPLLWAALLFAAPLSEETFFRGFLFRGWQESRLGGSGTVILTAALWALIHVQYDIFGVALVFAGGILLGYARLKTGSLLLCMALHAAMNFVATVEVEISMVAR